MNKLAFLATVSEDMMDSDIVVEKLDGNIPFFIILYQFFLEFKIAYNFVILQIAVHEDLLSLVESKNIQIQPKPQSPTEQILKNKENILRYVYPHLPVGYKLVISYALDKMLCNYTLGNSEFLQVLTLANKEENCDWFDNGFILLWDLRKVRFSFEKSI